jgi:uncharacterized protein (DUF2062 family)
MKKIWLAIERYVLLHSIRLFRIRGQSERVARGFALGLVVNFFPTFGFGVLLSGFVAKAFGGNGIAGIVGGATLTFVWPVLFYLNMRLGRFFVPPPTVVDELSDVTEKTIDALVWGKTFMAGAITNSLIFGLAAYFILRLVHWRIRPSALAYFRHHAVDHQRRFRRSRPAFSCP